VTLAKNHTTLDASRINENEFDMKQICRIKDPENGRYMHIHIICLTVLQTKVERIGRRETFCV